MALGTWWIVFTLLSTDQVQPVRQASVKGLPPLQRPSCIALPHWHALEAVCVHMSIQVQCAFSC